MLVDFTLTIAVSCAAAASALIAYAPGLAGERTAIAGGLAAIVALGSLGCRCHGQVDVAERLRHAVLEAS